MSVWGRKLSGLVVLGAVGLAPPAAAQCFHSGTCYAVRGSAYVTSSGSQQQGFNYLDNQTSGHAEEARDGSRAVTDVNLSDAAIRLFGNGSGVNGGNAASAFGAFYETVRFDLPNGVNSIRLPISVHLEGVNTPTQAGARFGGSLVVQMASYYLPGSNQSHFDVFSLRRNCGFEADFTQAICHSGNVSFDYSGFITIWEDVFYGIDYSTSILAIAGISDFQHTARFEWTLPPGVTFISGSDAFMSNQPAGVPELSTWTMLIVGFGAAGMAMRRRRQPAIAVA